MQTCLMRPVAACLCGLGEILCSLAPAHAQQYGYGADAFRWISTPVYGSTYYTTYYGGGYGSYWSWRPAISCCTPCATSCNPCACDPCGCNPCATGACPGGNCNIGGSSPGSGSSGSGSSGSGSTSGSSSNLGPAQSAPPDDADFGPTPAGEGSERTFRNYDSDGKPADGAAPAPGTEAPMNGEGTDEPPDFERTTPGTESGEDVFENNQPFKRESFKPAETVQQRKPAPLGDPAADETEKTAGEATEGAAGKDEKTGVEDDAAGSDGTDSSTDDTSTEDPFLTVPPRTELDDTITWRVTPRVQRIEIGSRFRLPGIARHKVDPNAGWVPVSDDRRIARN